jgi:mono/diheme cytochrome c family protein
VDSLPHPTRALAAAACVAFAAAAVGCGREEEPDLAEGKTLFVQKCGSCHELSRANTRGVQGPSLDAAFASARRDGLNEETVEGIVRDQIKNVRRNSIMPANLVKGQQAQDVAAYVAMAAAQPGKDAGELAQAGRPKVSKKPVEAKNGRLEIDADPTGALAYTAVNANAPAGKVEFVMKNEASVQHDIALKNGGELGKGPVVGKGGTSSFSASVKPGKYVFFCTVPGHEDGGMKGNLTVK